MPGRNACSSVIPARFTAGDKLGLSLKRLFLPPSLLSRGYCRSFRISTAAALVLSLSRFALPPLFLLLPFAFVVAQGCQMAKCDPFLSLDCARVEGMGAQAKQRKGSNFAAQRSQAIVLQARRAKHIQSKNLAKAIWQLCCCGLSLSLATLFVVLRIPKKSRSES